MIANVTTEESFHRLLKHWRHLLTYLPFYGDYTIFPFRVSRGVRVAIAGDCGVACEMMKVGGWNIAQAASPQCSVGRPLVALALGP